MGMGLSLVKKIVDKYGGKIWVEDRIKGNHNEGSNFVVLLKEAR
jgi:signal transduction histidine kinase